MSDPFIGEIKMFGGNFAPRGWALCDGQLLQIAQNNALFALLGTIYGGDGRTTFGLPDMRGRIPLHQGNASDLSNRPIGQKQGTERETLTVSQIPEHNHSFHVASDAPDTGYPAGQYLAANGGEELYSAAGAAPDRSLDVNAVSLVGGAQSHNNMMPYLCVNFIIALVGIFPSRS